MTKDQAMEKAGATREVAYRAYVEATKAELVHYDRYGDEVGREPDHPTRIKAADSISRLNGDMKDQLVAQPTSLTINITSSELKTLMEMASDVKNQLSSLRTDGHQTGEIIDVVAHNKQ